MGGKFHSLQNSCCRLLSDAIVFLACSFIFEDEILKKFFGSCMYAD